MILNVYQLMTLKKAKTFQFLNLMAVVQNPIMHTVMEILYYRPTKYLYTIGRFCIRFRDIIIRPQ